MTQMKPQTLNNDLTKIHEWATKWLVTFNAQKTKTMTISRKIDKLDHPPLYMDSIDSSTVSEHKHLGLVISDNGSWEKHIDMMTEKAYKRIDILRKFKFVLDRKTLQKKKRNAACEKNIIYFKFSTSFQIQK